MQETERAIRTAVQAAQKMAAISPKRTPRERVVAAPITRKPLWPAMVPTPSLSRNRVGPSKRSTRQDIFEVPTSRMATTPYSRAALRMARMARCC